jgi:hypothetical protein
MTQDTSNDVSWPVVMWWRRHLSRSLSTRRESLVVRRASSCLYSHGDYNARQIIFTLLEDQ